MCDTPLHLAVKATNWEMVFDLIAHGADIFAKDTNGKEPIDYLQSGASDDVYLYLLIPEDISDPRFTNNSLHRVIEDERWDLVGLVIEHGASLNQLEDMAYTPLHRKIMSSHVPSISHVQIVQKLISKENINMPTANGMGTTPLHLASSLLQWHLIPLLKQHGADINACDYANCTPLLSAFEFFSIVQAHLEKNVPVLDTDIYPIAPAEYFELPIVKPFFTNPAETLKLLLSHENVNVCNNFGQTAVSMVHCYQVWGLLPEMIKLDADFSELRDLDIQSLKTEKTGQPQCYQPATLKQLATSVVRTRLCSTDHCSGELVLPDWVRTELPVTVVRYLQLCHDVAERMVAELI